MCADGVAGEAHERIAHTPDPASSARLASGTDGRDLTVPARRTVVVMSGGARPAAVAGSFYPAHPITLRSSVERMLADAVDVKPDLDLRALIVPHAGHVYSGPVAASAYRLLGDAPSPPGAVGLIGPSHFAWFEGIALPGHDAVATPLGTIEVDPLAADVVARHLAFTSETAHRTEHSLEVQLPFLQVVLTGFTVLPALTGDEDPSAATGVIDAMLDAGLFVVVSSDLSHYHDHETARRLDAVTARAIVELRPDGLGRDSACGRTAVRAMLGVARRRGWSCARLDLRTSGDTAGPHDRVVGYGAFALGPA
jgi:MEMO1 family protein